MTAHAPGPRFGAVARLIAEAVEAVATSGSAASGGVEHEQARALAALEPPAAFDERLARAAALLDLDAVAASVLQLVAAPEVNPRYGRLFAYLQDHAGARFATPRLVSQLLARGGVAAPDVLAAFELDGSLRRRGALAFVPDPNGPTPLGERQVRLADRLAALVLGARLDDAPATGFARAVDPPAVPVGRDASVADVRARLAAAEQEAIVIAGPDAELVLAEAVGQGLLVVDLGRVEHPAQLADATIWATIERRQLCFDGVEQLDPARRRRAVQTFAAAGDRQLLLGAKPSVADALEALPHALVEVPLPSLSERRAIWEAVAPALEAEETAAKFRLPATGIVKAAKTARIAAAVAGQAQPSARHLDLGARRASTTGLGTLAQRLDAAYSWDDLVLNERARSHLGSISSHIRHRDLVLAEWGYDRSVAKLQGLKVLFAGDSGTGKTMAAQVLAAELGLAIFRLDIASLVSKYIGETEKNLDRVFGAAEGSNAILFFDEADALFGKRSEVSDAHDRYANIEVAYLLQKMEGYEGAVILATNFRNNIDDAFLRRLDFVIDFPFPDADDRRRIWELVLPAEAPRDEALDLDFLASRFRLSGGNIRNASLAGAFIAAEEGTAIGMRHLVKGVALEYGKLGRLTLESDFEQYTAHIRGL